MLPAALASYNPQRQQFHAGTAHETSPGPAADSIPEIAHKVGRERDSFSPVQTYREESGTSDEDQGESEPGESRSDYKAVDRGRRAHSDADENIRGPDAPETMPMRFLQSEPSAITLQKPWVC